MKNILDRISGSTVDQWVSFIFVIFVAGLAFAFIAMTTSNHIVRCSYLKSNATAIGVAYKIMHDVDWGNDITAFTTLDADRALEVIAAMNRCSKKQNSSLVVLETTIKEGK